MFSVIIILYSVIIISPCLEQIGGGIMNVLVYLQCIILTCICKYMWFVFTIGVLTAWFLKGCGGTEIRNEKYVLYVEICIVSGVAILT